LLAKSQPKIVEKKRVKRRPTIRPVQRATDSYEASATQIRRNNRPPIPLLFLSSIVLEFNSFMNSANYTDPTTTERGKSTMTLLETKSASARTLSVPIDVNETYHLHCPA